MAYTKVTPALRLYRGVLLFATPFILLRLWWRGRREPDYRRRIGERFGFVLRRGPAAGLGKKRVEGRGVVGRGLYLCCHAAAQ